MRRHAAGQQQQHQGAPPPPWATEDDDRRAQQQPRTAPSSSSSAPPRQSASPALPPQDAVYQRLDSSAPWAPTPSAGPPSSSSPAAAFLPGGNLGGFAPGPGPGSSRSSQHADAPLPPWAHDASPSQARPGNAAGAGRRSAAPERTPPQQANTTAGAAGSGSGQRHSRGGPPGAPPSRVRPGVHERPPWQGAGEDEAAAVAATPPSFSSRAVRGALEDEALAEAAWETPDAAPLRAGREAGVAGSSTSQGHPAQWPAPRAHAAGVALPAGALGSGRSGPMGGQATRAR